MLLGQWVLAGFGKEAIFRGYLFNRITDLVGDELPGLLVRIVANSLFFSLFHGWLGVPFFLLAFITGILYSLAYLTRVRTLWVPIIAHATVNSLGFVLALLT